MNHICGVMVSVLASNVVDLEFEPDRVKPKTEISICCFSARNIKNKEQRIMCPSELTLLKCY